MKAGSSEPYETVSLIKDFQDDAFSHAAYIGSTWHRIHWGKVFAGVVFRA